MFLVDDIKHTMLHGRPPLWDENLVAVSLGRVAGGAIHGLVWPGATDAKRAWGKAQPAALLLLLLPPSNLRLSLRTTHVLFLSTCLFLTKPLAAMTRRILPARGGLQ